MKLTSIFELTNGQMFQLISTGEIGVVKANNKEGVTYKLESKEDLQKIAKKGVMWVLINK